MPRRKEWKNIYPPEDTSSYRWRLIDARDGKELSRHPNDNGCKLSSLFHIEVGQTVWWKEVTPTAHTGTLDGEVRFKAEYH